MNGIAKTFLRYISSFILISATMMLSGCGAGTAGISPVPAVHNEWTWVSGANTGDALGIYGTQGTAGASNTPGARGNAIAWTDKSGNFWLFGGEDDGGINGSLPFNDLWEYNGGQWTWVGGSNTTLQSGVYGTQGVAAAGNVPGARSQAVSWIDGQGNLWLFGGEGMDSLGRDGLLNDLWRYAGGEWTWMTGSNWGSGTGTGGGVLNGWGIYGTKGVAGLNNTPGLRSNAGSWTDAAGNLWLFGGMGSDSNGQSGDLNDLWKYSGGQWTWMTGANVSNPADGATYGTLGTAASGNTPGARHGAVTWTDSSGNLWLFGGEGYDSTGQYGLLNDLWKYSADGWAWMAGLNTKNSIGTYGTQGIAVSGTVPGARSSAITWTGTDGSLWLFGGYGFDSTGTAGDMNDLWKYSGNQWIWVSGANKIEQAGTYGTKGTASVGNIPPSREGSVSWVDSSGNLWLFGGWSSLPTSLSALNDLWKYQP